MRGRGAGNSDEFIREVDEAVRQDRWLWLWKHYGTYAICAVVAIVLGTGAGVAWRSWQASQRQDEARRYAAADALLNQDRASEAAAAFKALAADADSGYRVVARLRAAQAEAEAGEGAAAADTLDGLAESGQARPVYSELGDLLTLQRDFDHADASDLESRVAALTDGDAPWRYSALELEALAQLRAGDIDGVRRTLETLLSDPRTPPNLSRRAAELMASVGGPGESGQDAAGAGAATGEADPESAPPAVPEAAPEASNDTAEETQ